MSKYHVEFFKDGQMVNEHYFGKCGWVAVMGLCGIKYRDGLDYESIRVYEFDKKGNMHFVKELQRSEI